MRHVAHIALQVIGWILDLIGLFGFPGDLVAAWSFLEKIQPYAESPAGRLVLLVIGTGLLTVVYGRWLARRWSQRDSIPPAEPINNKEKPSRLGFVMRSYPPFVDDTVRTPDDGATSYYTRYIGIKNLDNENTINNIRVQVIGGDQASSAIPMPLLDKTGKSSFYLSPNEMRLLVFTQQKIKQDGEYGSVRIPGANDSHIYIAQKGKQIVRLGAYGDDVSATAEFTFDFGAIAPSKMGEYPETNDVRVWGQLSFGRPRLITPLPTKPPDTP